VSRDRASSMRDDHGRPTGKAQQHSSIRIQDLTKVVMARRRLGLTEKRLVPFEAARNVAYTDDRPCAFRRLPTPSMICAGGNLVIERLNMNRVAVTCIA
jgi:hypothetical protein